MFGTLGGPEILLLLVLALIIFGPRKLPEIGKSMGRMLGEFRRASNDFKRTIEEEVETEKMREAFRSVDEPAPAAPAPPLALSPAVNEEAPTDTAPETQEAARSEPDSAPPALRAPAEPTVSREGADQTPAGEPAEAGESDGWQPR